MLPSKGYFRSIDCPFYKNNLCHRFYCHFRHNGTNNRNNRRENLYYSDLEMLDFINCEDNSTCQPVSEEVIMESMPNAGNQDSENSGEIIEAPYITTDVKQNNAYSLPIDIPQYKPTPISELKTRNKVFRETEEYNMINTDSKLIETVKDSSLIETLVGYFMEDDVHKKSKYSEHSLESEIACKTLSCKEISISDSLNCKADSTTEEHINKDNYSICDSSFVVQEKGKFKEMITQLEKNDSFSKPNYKEILDNETLLEDLMGTDSNISDYNNLDEADTTKLNPDLVIKEKDTKYFDESLNKYKTTQEKHHTQKYKHQIGRKAKNSLSGTRNEKHDNTTKNKSIIKPSQTKKHCKQIVKNLMNDKIISKNVNDIISNTLCGPEVILLSDSDDEVKVDNISNATLDENKDPVVEDLPKPKQKIRISYATCQNSSLIQHSGNSLRSKLKRASYCKPIINETENYCTARKQKIRIAHTIKYQTLSMQSVQGHLAHWGSVKERVKNKCTNPDEIAGCKNWAKVKISPVSNVESLINSKKLLYSKIHQWKSKV